MAQMPNVRPTNDIYTVLLGIACAVALGTLCFVLYRANLLFGTPFPGIK